MDLSSVSMKSILEKTSILRISNFSSDFISNTIITSFKMNNILFNPTINKDDESDHDDDSSDTS
jgi:hypothetical protein